VGTLTDGPYKGNIFLNKGVVGRIAHAVRRIEKDPSAARFEHLAYKAAFIEAGGDIVATCAADDRDYAVMARCMREGRRAE